MIQFLDARPEHDPELTRLMALPMPGNLSLAFCREPSYLAGCQRCGPPRHVLTAHDGSRLVALCSYFLREYEWAGTPRQVWTLSDFRALPEAAGQSVTGRGWKAIRERLNGLPAIISVLGDNARALRLFHKPRPDWPRLHPVAELTSNLTPLLNPAAGRPRLTVHPLTKGQLVDYVNSSKEPLRPLIESRDFGSVLPSIDRFWGVSRGGKLVGCAGLSETPDYRQIRIQAYHGWYARLYRLNRALRLPLMPAPGTHVPISTASLLLCPDPAAFRALFQHLKHEARRAGSRFLVWSRGGPDNSTLLDRLRFRMPSRLYQLLWDGDSPLPALTGPRGFEVAWL